MCRMGWKHKVPRWLSRTQWKTMFDYTPNSQIYRWVADSMVAKQHTSLPAGGRCYMTLPQWAGHLYTQWPAVHSTQFIPGLPISGNEKEKDSQSAQYAVSCARTSSKQSVDQQKDSMNAWNKCTTFLFWSTSLLQTVARTITEAPLSSSICELRLFRTPLCQ